MKISYYQSATLSATLVLMLCSALMYAQSTDPRLSAYEVRNGMITNGELSAISAANIGPTVFSGRVSDIAVNPANPAEFYVAYASGGLWHTNNNGTTFSPIFDQEAVMTIGDVAVDWEHDVIWVGTGEVNSSRSSYAGVGMYRSADRGKTWEHLGLPESHHIGRVVLHPSDQNTAWVAVLGHLYTTNPERGVYMTSDGGASWQRTLYVNDNSGAVDLVIDPADPKVLYAATWDRIRHAWDFQESGAGSGIHKSIDGGRTWSKLSVETSGFPQGEGVGRIGLDAVATGGKTILYAILDNYGRRPVEDKDEEDVLSKTDFESMSGAQFEALANEDLQEYLDDNGFDDKYDAAAVKSMVQTGKIAPISLKEYVEDANSLLFDTPVVGAEVYRSEDGGATWQKTHDGYLDGVFNSYGYYFAQIRANPTNPKQVYIMGVPILRSDDGGAAWSNVSGQNVHADHHALWINPDLPGHIINGNDGGINISYDAGENWIKCNSPSVGQFYYINVDNAPTYNVYGGTQDNGVWLGSNNYREGVRWQMSGEYPYQSIMGGDGMQVQIDNRDNNTVYTGYQFGNYFRINKESGDRSYITPKHKLGDRPYRWNWQSPILLSPHNQDILYMGANKLLRSMDQGATFTELSGDLTTGGKMGDVAFGTMTTISESVFRFGLIYVGTDDGKVWRTEDSGRTWIDLSSDLPVGKWVSRIIASTHEEGVVYLSLNGYRDDDFTSYVYRSADYGDTWTDIAKMLPSEPVNVIKEDPSTAAILYVGTDHGTYVSMDAGGSWTVIGGDMPRVPVHDLVVQSRENHLLIGTHGRSIYQVDLAPVQSLEEHRSKGLYLYEVSGTRARKNWGSKRNVYSDVLEPKITMDIYAAAGGSANLTVMYNKKSIYQKSIDLVKGLSNISYDLSVLPERTNEYEKQLQKVNDDKKMKVTAGDNGVTYLRPGDYQIVISQAGKTTEQTLTIK